LKVQPVADARLPAEQSFLDRLESELFTFLRSRRDAMAAYAEDSTDLVERSPAWSGRAASASVRCSASGATGPAAARRIARLKSGSYSMVGPLLIGCALAGGRAAVSEALARYGVPLGEAFQLRDDVLGTFGDPARTGKDRDTDIREGKPTALVAKALRLGTPATRRLLVSSLGREDLTGEEVEEVRVAIRDSGALAETMELVSSLAVRAKAELLGAGIPAEVARALEGLADVVALRDA
jgi:geranylgeranyl diphosphate synthase, type I